MKLTPMIRFVKKQGNIGMEVQSIGHQQSDRARRFYLIQKYADFLLKDISIGMTIPCDEFGNVLKEPKSDNENWTQEKTDKYFEDLMKYNQAKERVLFKGFKVINSPKDIMSRYPKRITDSSGLIVLFWFDSITQTWSLSNGLSTIETLTVFGSIELTETALKDIGIPNNETNE